MDIVFYVVLHRLKPVDIEFIRRLTPFTSVLPIIAKSDTLTPSQVSTLKLSILSELRAANIRPFLFGKTSSELMRAHLAGGDGEQMSSPHAPFAISSAVTEDMENMDASVLMSPEYLPPLMETELTQLVGEVFCPENITWLKHLTAKKFLKWRSKSSLPPTNSIPQPLTPNMGSLVLPSGPDSFALARVADHTQREERLAKVRLNRWAADLQRSLLAERERFERLARGERAVWLTERLNEVVMDGQLVPLGQQQQNSLRRRGMAKDSTGKLDLRQLSVEGQYQVEVFGMRVGGGKEGMGMDVRDPFGLVRMNEALKRRVVVLVKVGGLAGVVGVVGVWVLRNWGEMGVGVP